MALNHCLVILAGLRARGQRDRGRAPANGQRASLADLHGIFDRRVAALEHVDRPAPGKVCLIAAADVQISAARVVLAISAPVLAPDARAVGSPAGPLLRRQTEVGIGVERDRRAYGLARRRALEGGLAVLVAERACLRPAADHDRLAGDRIRCGHDAAAERPLRPDPGVVAMDRAPCASGERPGVRVRSILHLDLDPLHALGRGLTAHGAEGGVGWIELKRHRGCPSVWCHAEAQAPAS